MVEHLKNKITVSGQDASDELFKSDDPQTAIERCLPQDLMVVWHSADYEQKFTILKYAGTRQIHMLIDILAWKGDSVDLIKLEELISPVTSGNIEEINHVAKKIPWEPFILMLQNNVKVHIRENQNDEIPARGSSELITFPGGVFSLEIFEPEKMGSLLRAFITAMMVQPFEEYQKVLRSVKEELPSNLEEDAFKWRSNRLADFGFPEWEEAASILSPLTLHEVENAIDKKRSKKFFVHSNIKLPMILRNSLVENDFFDTVVLEIEHLDKLIGTNTLEILNTQLAAMTNRFLAAMRVNLGDIDEVKIRTRWARDIFSLGLCEVSKSDVQKAAGQLTSVMPALFLQLGLGFLYPLGNRALKLTNNPLTGAGKLTAFDPPYQFMINSLSVQIPGRWPPLEEGRDKSHEISGPLPGEVVAFGSVRQVKFYQDMLAEAEALEEFLSVLSVKDYVYKFQVPASVLAVTVLANNFLSKPGALSPVTAAESEQFAKAALKLSEEEFEKQAFKVYFSTEQTGESPKKPVRRLVKKLITIGMSRLQAGPQQEAVLLK